MAGERANGSDFGANGYAVRHRGDLTEKSLSRRVARASPLVVVENPPSSSRSRGLRERDDVCG